MSTTALQQALTEAVAKVRHQYPELTDEAVSTAYVTYRTHFRQGDEDPPVSTDPAVDELLLALWDVIVDRETAGLDQDIEDLEQYYAQAFDGLSNPPTPTAPVALTPPPDASTEPAPILTETLYESKPPGETTDEDEELSIYQLKIVLDGSNPQIWRRVLVSKHVTLTNLHHVIQSVMGWSESHMHQFYPQQDRPIARTGGAQLSDLLYAEGEHCGYEYDFGDSWYHDLELERKLAAEPGRQYPVCIAGQRACPPEDVGGIPGYAKMLDILKDPTHPEYEDMAGWLTQDFNPAAFNIDQANMRLGRHGQAAFQSAT